MGSDHTQAGGGSFQSNRCIGKWGVEAWEGVKARTAGGEDHETALGMSLPLDHPFQDTWHQNARKSSWESLAGPHRKKNRSPHKAVKGLGPKPSRKLANLRKRQKQILRYQPWDADTPFGPDPEVPSGPQVTYSSDPAILSTHPLVLSPVAIASRNTPLLKTRTTWCSSSSEGGRAMATGIPNWIRVEKVHNTPKVLGPKKPHSCQPTHFSRR